MNYYLRLVFKAFKVGCIFNIITLILALPIHAIMSFALLGQKLSLSSIYFSLSSSSARTGSSRRPDWRSGARLATAALIELVLTIGGLQILNVSRWMTGI